MTRPKRYDAIVIGAGSGGSTCAGALAQRGRSVAIVERERVGGECAFWACIPTKSLLRASQLGMTFAEAAAWRTANVDAYDDAKHADDLKNSGVDLLRGQARVLAPGSIEVEDAVYAYGALAIATGSENAPPPIDGLSDGPYWSSREATAAGDLPASLVVLGGGAVGVELAQAFARFGSHVTLVEKADRILEHEEPETVAYVADGLRACGVELILGAAVSSVKWRDGGATVAIEGGRAIETARVLAAAGRRARTDGLDLAMLGVVLDDQGAIVVDERCAAAPDVYAVGDVTGVAMFTHVAKYQGRIAAAAMCGAPARARYDAVPRCVFSEPEHAAVGLTERQARERGIACACEVVDLEDASSRAFLYAKDGVRGGLKIVVDVEKRTLAGASIAAPMASEMILACGRAIRAAVPIETLSDTIAPYPTFSEMFFTALDRAARAFG